MEPTSWSPPNLSNIVQQNAHAVRSVDRRLQNVQSRLDAIVGTPGNPSGAHPADGTFPVMPAYGAREAIPDPRSDPNRDRFLDPDVGRVARSMRRSDVDEDPTSYQGQARHPPLDLLDAEDAFVLEADLPGIDEADVELTVSADGIRIVGTSHPSTDGTFLVSERLPATYERSLVLPAEIDVDEVEAEFEDGRLTVTLPKVETGKTTRRIRFD